MCFLDEALSVHSSVQGQRQSGEQSLTNHSHFALIGRGESRMSSFTGQERIKYCSGAGSAAPRSTKFKWVLRPATKKTQEATRFPLSPLYISLILWRPKVGKKTENPRFSWLLSTTSNQENPGGNSVSPQPTLHFTDLMATESG